MYAPPDLTCPACGALTPARSRNCQRCDHPLQPHELKPLPPVYPSPPPRRGMLLGWLLSGLVLAGVGGFIALSASGALSSLGLGEWYGSQFCLVDMNHDGAQDLLGFGGNPETPSLQVVSGLDGASLSRGAAYPSGTQLFCADPRTALMTFPDFRIVAVGPDAKTRWEKRLSDQVAGTNSIQVKDGCAAFYSLDQQTHWLSLDDGSPCAGTPPARLDSWSSSPGPTTAHLGTLDLSLSVRATGTQVLTLQASRAGVERWRTELPAKLSGTFRGTPILAAHEGVVLVAGADLADNYLTLFGFDAETGKPLFTRRAASHWSNQVMDWHQDGPRLFIQWGFGMHAYQVKDGLRVWNIGGR